MNVVCGTWEERDMAPFELEVIAVSLKIAGGEDFAIDKPERFGNTLDWYFLPVGSAARPPAGFCF